MDINTLFTQQTFKKSRTNYGLIFQVYEIIGIGGFLILIFKNL
jgi:hypothetical protein